ncbi:hypothetical protein ACFS27_13615 [Promicromonospora vindobonensis]|uniref:Uncharacterized protein n=1 Tax=Promicromonospora vindobonensis TaxID=195748 RepID=A0ABW5VSF4_9MICO
MTDRNTDLGENLDEIKRSIHLIAQRALDLVVLQQKQLEEQQTQSLIAYLQMSRTTSTDQGASCNDQQLDRLIRERLNI